MRNYYIITDTHFNHEAKMCLEEIGRPLDYAEKIYKSLIALKKEDVLIHKGDICIGKDKEMHKKYIKPLKCKKILVRGNHDNKSNGWYMDNGWDFVCDTFTMKYDGKKILFSHIPQPWDGISDINIHGHLHNCSHRENPPLHFNKLLSLEFDGYRAHSLSSFIKKLNT